MKFRRLVRPLVASPSLPVRGAWIEIICLGKLIAAMLVAPRAGSVD